MRTPSIATVVFPTQELARSVEAWSAVFGHGPAFSSDGVEKTPDSADFAVFTEDGLEIGVTSRPWVDGPLVFFATDDILATRDDLIHAGAIPLAETTGGGLALLGSAPVVNGDPATGVVDVPGHRLAVLRLVDGTFVGLRQTTRY